MKKQIIISAIGLILVLCMVANADEEEARRMHEVEQMRLGVEKLQLEAMEHELLARQLRMEAARINLDVRTEMLHIQRQRQQRMDIERMERRIDELRQASERAEKDGQVDKARRLWKESKHLAEELERRIEDRRHKEHADRMCMRMGELGKALEKAEREGRERQADELREEIGNLKREIREHEREVKTEHFEREIIHHLLAEAEKAEEKGECDEADAMRREAAQLKHYPNELCEECPCKDCPKKECPGKVCPCKDCSKKECPKEVCPDKECPKEVCPCKECPNRECDKKCEGLEDDQRDDSDELWDKIESLHRQLAELNEVVELLRNKLK